MAAGMKRKAASDEPVAVSTSIREKLRKPNTTTTSPPYSPSSLTSTPSSNPTTAATAAATPPPTPSPATTRLQQIASATHRTPFERRVWRLLCQIPAGSVTTYALLSAHLGSSPRAVGNALRRNPFAPQVPCHRCVATGGRLGGFKGKIAARDGEGVTLDEKRALLRAEGVRFDASGKVLGTPFAGFV